MRIRRITSKVKRNPIYIGYFLIGIIFLIGVILAVKYTGKDFTQTKENKIVKNTAKYEVTEVDLFSIKDFNSKEISVMGITLGDSIEETINKIGYPDRQSQFPPNIINTEYSSNLGLGNQTGLILHFENDKLTRITFKEPFNKYLIGKTKIQHSKDDIYHLFGKPTETKFVPITKGSALLLRNIIYGDKGLEFIVRRNKELGFSLVY